MSIAYQERIILGDWYNMRLLASVVVVQNSYLGARGWSSALPYTFGQVETWSSYFIDVVVRSRA
jgi:hypothetical protein